MRNIQEHNEVHETLNSWFCRDSLKRTSSNSCVLALSKSTPQSLEADLCCGHYPDYGFSSAFWATRELSAHRAVIRRLLPLAGGHDAVGGCSRGPGRHARRLEITWSEKAAARVADKAAGPKERDRRGGKRLMVFVFLLLLFVPFFKRSVTQKSFLWNFKVHSTQEVWNFDSFF